MYTRFQELLRRQFLARMSRYSLRFLSLQIMASHTSAVIRMFGIFTHAQLDRGRFWDSFSQQLQHQGSDYIERCTFRNKPLNTGDNVILPAIFPPLSHQVQDVPTTLVKVREEDMKNVSEMAGWCVLNILIKCMYDRSIPCLCTLSRRHNFSHNSPRCN